AGRVEGDHRVVTDGVDPPVVDDDPAAAGGRGDGPVHLAGTRGHRPYAAERGGAAKGAHVEGVVLDPARQREQRGVGGAELPGAGAVGGTERRHALVAVDEDEVVRGGVHARPRPGDGGALPHHGAVGAVDRVDGGGRADVDLVRVEAETPGDV